jgi:hypothetical protein
MRTLYLLVLLFFAPSPRYVYGQYPPRPQDSVQTSVPSIDSIMTILDAYADKRISADSAAKVIVDYLLGTKESLNVQMDAELRDAVNRELKARKGSR